MKIVYLILILVLLYFVFAYAQFRYVLSHANLDEIKQEDREFGAGPKIKYIAAGDSTAVGLGASKVENTYAYRVGQYLSQKNTVEYRNIAVIGDQTKDVINNQLKTIIDFNPDVVTISIGANDVTHWVSKKKIVENYQIIIKELTEKTHATIYITDIAWFHHAYLLPWIFRQYFDMQASSVSSELLKLETSRVKFVDIHSIPTDTTRDKFHPNDKGYEAWTNAFLEKIRTDYH